MKILMASVIIAGLFTAVSGFAKAPADAPADSTGLCKDGKYYSGAVKKGACRGHKGIKEWYGATRTGDIPATPTGNTPATPPTSTGAVPAGNADMKPAKTQAQGGGPGMVWANDSSKVYHCTGDRWYGKTKRGEYLSEAEAKSKGFKPDHGKPCKS